MPYGEILAQQLGTQGASQAAGGLIDMAMQPWRNKNQRKQNQVLIDQQIAAQKEMGIFNIERQMELWNRTNAGAQMEHYKKAGLNPALMYGTGGAGGSTAAAMAGNVGQASADAKPGGHTGMAMMMPAQVRLLEAQARNLDADTAKKSGVETQLGNTTIEKLKADTSNTKVKTALDKLQLHINEITQEDVTDIMSLNAQKIQQEVFQLQNATDISDTTKQTVIQTVKQAYINAQMQEMAIKAGIKLTEAQINKLAADIEQRGWELAIQEFKAEIEANQPGINETVGGMINSIKNKVDKIFGIKKEYITPRQIKR